MTENKPGHPATHTGPPAAETELHASVEGLQVQVRALATAIDHLCRAVEAAAPDAARSPEMSSAIEDARESLGKIW
jgi:hypothetical protein